NDNVQWVNEGGQRSNVPVRDVRRVDLKPDVAKQAFGGAAAPEERGRNAQGPAPAGSSVVRVDARQAWTDTGIDVRRGDRISFNGRGDIMLAPGASSGDGGNPAVRGLFPVRNAPGGALIGRIGDRDLFAIGADSQPITMAVDGRLMLGVNDNNFSDNSGVYTVTIRRDRVGHENDSPRRRSRPFER